MKSQASKIPSSATLRTTSPKTNSPTYSKPGAGRARWLGVAAALLVVSRASADLINGGFQLPVMTPVGIPDFRWIDQTGSNPVPGWHTTASDNQIEIWGYGFGSVSSFAGSQHAEINATQVGTLFQDSTGIPNGGLLDFTFAHRGRFGVDTLRLTITDLGPNNLLGGSDDTVLFTKEYSTGNGAWAQYTSLAEPDIFALGNDVRFAYASVSSAGGFPDGGNFIDEAHFGVGVLPEPSSAMLLIGSGMTFLLRRRRVSAL